MKKAKKTVPKSPFDRTPNDCVGEIFLFCLDTAAPSSPDQAPLLLCHVSHHWRAVAIQTPQLWNHISIRNKGKVDPEGSANFLLNWMRRAQKLPLHITIYDDRLDPPRLFTKFWKRLSPTFHKWETLHLKVEFIDMYPLLQDGGMTHLRVLHLQHQPPLQECPSGRWPKVMQYTPLSLGVGFILPSFPVVEEITARVPGGISLRGDFPPRRVDASHLRTLDCVLSRKMGDDVFDQLRLLTNLEVLECEIGPPPEDSDDDLDFFEEQLITFHRLHTLSLSSLFTPLGRVLDVLLAPKLKKLTVETFSPMGVEHLHTGMYLSNFVGRSKVSLDSLSAIGCSTPDLYKCLALNPSLTFVYGAKALSELLNTGKLSASAQAPKLVCPNLEDLGFMAGKLPYQVTELYPTRILEVMSSRSRFSVPNPDPPHTLRIVRFNVQVDAEDHVPNWFNDFVKVVDTHPTTRQHVANGFCVGISFLRPPPPQPEPALKTSLEERNREVDNIFGF